MADEKATQEAVDAAVKEVADAVAGLAEKPAVLKRLKIKRSHGTLLFTN